MHAYNLDLQNLKISNHILLQSGHMTIEESLVNQALQTTLEVKFPPLLLLHSPDKLKQLFADLEADKESSIDKGKRYGHDRCDRPYMDVSIIQDSKRGAKETENDECLGDIDVWLLVRFEEANN